MPLYPTSIFILFSGILLISNAQEAAILPIDVASPSSTGNFETFRIRYILVSQRFIITLKQQFFNYNLLKV